MATCKPHNGPHTTCGPWGLAPGVLGPWPPAAHRPARAWDGWNFPGNFQWASRLPGQTGKTECALPPQGQLDPRGPPHHLWAMGPGGWRSGPSPTHGRRRQLPPGQFLGSFQEISRKALVAPIAPQWPGQGSTLANLSALSYRPGSFFPRVDWCSPQWPILKFWHAAGRAAGPAAS